MTSETIAAKSAHLKQSVERSRKASRAQKRISKGDRQSTPRMNSRRRRLAQLRARASDIAARCCCCLPTNCHGLRLKYSIGFTDCGRSRAPQPDCNLQLWQDFLTLEREICHRWRYQIASSLQLRRSEGQSARGMAHDFSFLVSGRGE